MTPLQIWIIEHSYRTEVTLEPGDHLSIRRAESHQHAGTLQEVPLTDRTRRFVYWSRLPEISQEHLDLRLDPEKGLIAIDRKSTNGVWSRRPRAVEWIVEPGSELMLSQNLVLHCQTDPLQSAARSGQFASVEDFIIYLRSQLGTDVDHIEVTKGSKPDFQRQPGKKYKVLALLRPLGNLVVGWKSSTINLSQDRLLTTEVTLFNCGAFNDNSSLRSKPWEFLAASPPRAQVLAMAQRVAPTDETVLLEGGSGTGKEVLAHDIHEHSHRGKGAFKPVNCSTLPSHLIEGELFGWERGSFTGAIGAKAGFFEAADGGTLFLDEIGDLPLDLQPKLLRVLQEKKFRRVGSTIETAVDVRIIAATHRDLAKMVQEGRFRQDLYHRLCCVPLRIPDPEPADIALLVPELLPQYAKIGPQAVMQDEIRRLSELAQTVVWSGNVRQLEQTLRRYVTFRDPRNTIEQNWEFALRHGPDSSGSHVSAYSSGGHQAAESAASSSGATECTVLMPDNLIAATSHFENLVFLQTARALKFPYYRGAFTELGKQTSMTGAGAAQRLRRLLKLESDALPEKEQIDARIEEERRNLEPFLPYLRRLLKL